MPAGVLAPNPCWLPPPVAGASPDTDSKEARQARQLLASRHWVPALPEAAGSGSDSGSGISGEAAGPKPPACTALGEDLAAALRQHCPGTSLQDVRRWALLLWLDIGSSAVMTGRPRAPPAQRLLLVCQQALSGLPLTPLERARCVHTACKMVCGAELHAAALLAPRGQRLVELVEAGLAEAEAGRVHIRAAALARELSMLLMVRSKGEAGQARAASLARVDELMAWCRCGRQPGCGGATGGESQAGSGRPAGLPAAAAACARPLDLGPHKASPGCPLYPPRRSALVKGCKAWLPASTARQLAALDRHLKQVLAEGARNDATSERRCACWASPAGQWGNEGGARLLFLLPPHAPRPDHAHAVPHAASDQHSAAHRPPHPCRLCRAHVP